MFCSVARHSLYLDVVAHENEVNHKTAIDSEQNHTSIACGIIVINIQSNNYTPDKFLYFVLKRQSDLED